MSVWELTGYSTESYGDVAIRHREYTTSKRTATLFAQVPRIDFTDSGHGIVFVAEPHQGKRKPVRLMEHVATHMAQLRRDLRAQR